MTFQTFVFYAFAAILLFAATRVITARNPVHAALFLVLAFGTTAGLWMLLEAEFLAIALILVYVGAVMVLFLFVVMMLDINIDRLREGYWDYLAPGLTVAAIMVLEMAIVLGGRHAGLLSLPVPTPKPAGYSNTREVGRVLYTDYALPFEIAAVIRSYWSGVRSRLAAPTFSSRCATLDVPGIGRITGERRRSQASATWPDVALSVAAACDRQLR